MDRLAAAAHAFENGDLDHASELFTAHREEHPESFEAAFYLGQIHFEQERHGDAVERLEEAVALDGDSIDGHLWLGKALSEYIHQIVFFRKLPMAKRILAVFQRAVEIDPRSVEGHTALARYYSEAPSFAGGNRDLSLEHAQILIDLDPVEGHRLLSSIYVLLKEPELAKREIERAFEALAKNADRENREEIEAELEERLQKLSDSSRD